MDRALGTISTGDDLLRGHPPSPDPIFTGLPIRHRFRELRQVMRPDPPADPPTHPTLAVIAAPLQPLSAPQDVDPPLDPRPGPITPPEPPLLLPLPPPRGRPTHARQGAPFHTRLPRQPLVGRRR